MNESAGIRVLHVDDEPDLIELAADMLEREDDRFTVETATSARKGLERLRDATDEFDCIVSDYQMPGQNGIEFFETVREDYPNLPFILFTGKGSEEVASDAISAGITDYLQKGSGTEQYTVLANRIRNAVEKRRSERARQRHLEAIETAHEGISILNEDGRFLYVNEAYADLYGYDPDEMVGEHWEVIYPEDEVETARETILPEVEETGFWHGTTTGLRADGSTFPEDHRVATTDHSELVCTVREMTERKQREQELDRTNTVLRTIVEHLPMGVLVEDAERDVLMANDRLGETLGVPLDSDDLIGRDCDAAAEEFQDLFADPEGFIDGLNERIEQREPVHNEELPLADGRVLERDYVPYSLPDGEANLWLYRDITDRKEREQELKRREAYLEYSRDIVTVVDADGTVQFQSESTEQVTGFSPSEVMGESGFEHVHPDDRDEITSLFTSVIDQPDEVASAELRVETREGSWRWIEARGVNKLADPVIDGIVISSRDITERKEYEQELNIRAKAMDTAIDGMALLNDDEEYVYVNEAHADIYGYDDPEAFLGETWRMCYDDEEIERFEEAIIPALSEEGSWRGEVTGRRKDGSTFPQELSLTATDDGGMIGVVRDITERKQKERDLKRERDRYTTLFHNLPTPVVHGRMIDGEVIVQEVNPAFEDTFGHDSGAIEGDPLHDHILPEGETKIESINQQLLEKGELQTELQRKTEYGVRDFRVDVTIRNSDAETLEGYAVYTDITERKEHEDALEELHSATRDLMTATTTEEVATRASETATQVLKVPMNGVHLYDAETNLLMPVAWADDTEELLDGSPPALPVDDSLAGQVYHTGEAQSFANMHEIDETFNSDPPFHSECILPLGDHGVFILSSPESDVFDATDEALADVFASNVEAALDNVEQRQELQRERDRLDEFASIISHDLRSPLSVAMGRVELAQRECDSEHLDDVTQALDRMGALIDDVLTLAQEGEQVDELEAINLADTIDRCWRNVETANATLVNETDRIIRADASRLQQLLENLFRNAVEHGGTEVTITVGDLDNRGGFYVVDDGPGIPESEREDVFEAGYSTDKGTGLGLNIVQEIAHAHGWNITVTDSESGGARFEITGVETVAE